MLLSLLCVQMFALAWGIAAGPRLGGPHAQVFFLEGPAGTAAALGTVSCAKVPGVADVILLRDGQM